MSTVEHRRTTGHASPVVHVALRADGRRLAGCSYDGRVFVGETSARADLSVLTSLRRGRRVIAADGNPAATEVLATAPADRTAAVWRRLLTAGLELIAAFRVPAAAVRSVAWIAGDQQLLVGACDGSVHLVDRAGRRLWHSGNAGLWPMSKSAAGGLVAVGGLLGVPHLLRQSPG